MTKKKNPVPPVNPVKKPEQELFPAAKGVRPADSQWWTGAQFAAFIHSCYPKAPAFDEPKLRALGHSSAINPLTSAPWIPKPRAAKFEFTPTLKGVLAYLLHQLDHADSLPKQCSGMNVVEGIFKISVEVQKKFKEKGFCPAAFESSNRVNVLPLVAALGEKMRQIITAGTKLHGIEGFEELDKDVMQARVAAQVEIEKIRENNLANGNLFTRETVEKILEPVAAWGLRWKNYEKDTGGKLKSLLTGAGVDAAIVAQAIAIAKSGVIAPPLELREQLKLNGENHE